MASNRTMEVQQQIRVNSGNLKDYLTDLENWEKDMKRKELETKNYEEKDMKRKELETKNYEEKDMKRKELETKNYEEKDMKRKELETKNYEEKAASKAISLDMKEAGNRAFKSGDYEKAIEYYTRGIKADPINAALLLANRALAYMKIGKETLAEEDCTRCLTLDRRHVKAYLRRGTIRAEAGRLGPAREDFLEVLKVEPQNKEAKAGLVKIDKSGRLQSETRKGIDEKKPDSGFSPSFFDDGGGDTEKVNIIMNPSETQSKKPMISTIKTNPAKSEETNVSAATAKKQEIRKDSVPEPTIRLEPLTVVPEVPQRSYQFSADWSRLEGQQELQFQYLSHFPPERLPTMFNHSMDVMVFTGILRVLSEEFVRRDIGVYGYVKGLSGVGRFKTLLSMLSDSEMKYVSVLMQAVEGECDAADKKDVMKKYER